MRSHADQPLLAVIPARGNSKRLPLKNILLLDGRPLLSHTIEAALGSKLFERVVVSTENVEISKIAKFSGAEVIDRSPEVMDYKTRVPDVCRQVLREVVSNKGMPYKVFCVLTATSALRNTEDILRSYEIFLKGYDFVISTSQYFFSPFVALTVSQDGKASFFWRNTKLNDLQNMPSVEVDNGAIKWCRTDAFLREGELMGSNTGIYRMPKSRSIDVNTEEDYRILCALYNDLMKGVGIKE